MGDVDCSSFSIGGLDILVLVEQAAKALTNAGLNDQSITALRRQLLETDTSSSSCSKDGGSPDIGSGDIGSGDIGSGDDGSDSLANVEDVCTDYAPEKETIWYTSTAGPCSSNSSR